MNKGAISVNDKSIKGFVPCFLHGASYKQGSVAGCVCCLQVKKQIEDKTRTVHKMDKGVGMNKRYKVTYIDYVWAVSPEKALSLAEAEVGPSSTVFAEYAVVEEVDPDE